MTGPSPQALSLMEEKEVETAPNLPMVQLYDGVKVICSQ